MALDGENHWIDSITNELLHCKRRTSSRRKFCIFSYQNLLYGISFCTFGLTKKNEENKRPKGLQRVQNKFGMEFTYCTFLIIESLRFRLNRTLCFYPINNYFFRPYAVLNREVPRSADYEYEYVWVSRILTRWLSVLQRTYWQIEDECEYDVVGRVKLAAPRPLRVSRPLEPYSTCVQAHSRSLRMHFTAEFAPFFTAV